jgi:hypothetical protein
MSSVVDRQKPYPSTLHHQPRIVVQITVMGSSVRNIIGRFCFGSPQLFKSGCRLPQPIPANQLHWPPQLENGYLLNAAEMAAFDVMVTADQNIRYRQNLSGRKLALVVLGSNVWPIVRGHGATIAAKVMRRLREATTSSKCRFRQSRAQGRRRGKRIGFAGEAPPQLLRRDR